MDTEFERAYFAGLIDGDGCIFLAGQKHAAISLGMTDEHVVRAAKEAFGVGSVAVRQPGKGKRRKTAWVWKATYKSGRRAIALIQPYLVEKADTARAVIGPCVPIEISREGRTAYFAGLFDAEGYVAVRTPKNRSPAVQLALGMNHEPTIRAIAEHFGAGSIMERPAGWCGRKNPHYTWRASARAARAVLIAMLPYLRVKADAARHALAVPVMPIGHKPDGWKPAPRQPNWKPLKRRRIYATAAERSRAFRARKKARGVTQTGSDA